MKKIFCCLVLLLFVSGCGMIQKEEEKATEEPTPTASATQQPETTEVPTPEPTPIATPEPVLLGSAQTELLDQTESRIHNISLAIGSLNGFELEPKEAFSFNKVVGERTPERGYEKATVIIQLEKRQDYGGGVCQVSSTLYQAAAEAGLSITERHSHQKDVGYAHQGEDAAVDYGNKDLQFVNNTDSVLRFNLYIAQGEVGAEIYQLP